MDEDVAQALADDLARLAARPYAETGVPMFLLAEGVSGAGEPALASALAALAAAGETTATAPLVEVIADRHLLGSDGPSFTRLSDDGAAR